MRYASRDLKPLRQIAIIDDETLTFIASQVEATDISGKVDKIPGKGLSTEDYTTAEKNKLAGLSSSSGFTQSQILTRQL